MTAAVVWAACRRHHPAAIRTTEAREARAAPLTAVAPDARATARAARRASASRRPGQLVARGPSEAWIALALALDAAPVGGARGRAHRQRRRAIRTIEAKVARAAALASYVVARHAPPVARARGRTRGHSARAVQPCEAFEARAPAAMAPSMTGAAVWTVGSRLPVAHVHGSGQGGEHDGHLIHTQDT